MQAARPAGRSESSTASRPTAGCASSHQPTGLARFGDVEYAEPWLAHRVFADPRARRLAAPLGRLTPTACCFPRVLQELDLRDGALLQRVLEQRLHRVRCTRPPWAGRPVVLVGGTNNDVRGASLAIFDPVRAGGTTPAVRPGYPVGTAHRAGPRDLFIFPSLCICAASAGRRPSHAAWVEQGDAPCGRERGCQRDRTPAS